MRIARQIHLPDLQGLKGKAPSALIGYFERLYQDLQAFNKQIQETINGLGTGIGDSPTFVKVTLTGNEMNIATTQTPASASATGTKGDIAWDENYIYICVAANTWKRAALSTWGTDRVTFAGEPVTFDGEEVTYGS